MFMRKFSTFLFLFLLTAVMTGGALHAQMKIAYIDAAKLLKKMPEAVDADSRLDQLVQSWNKDADDMQNELNRKKNDYDHRKLIMTDAERTASEVELQNLKKKLDDFRQAKYGTNGDLFAQQASLMKPAYDRLLKAVDETAKEGNYDYVFDRGSRDFTMLYSNSRHDLTLQVAKKLNLELDLVNQPLVNTPNQPANGQRTSSQTQQQFPVDKHIPNGQPQSPNGVPVTPNGVPPSPGNNPSPYPQTSPTQSGEPSINPNAATPGH